MARFASVVRSSRAEHPSNRSHPAIFMDLCESKKASDEKDRRGCNYLLLGGGIGGGRVRCVDHLVTRNSRSRLLSSSPRRDTGRGRATISKRYESVAGS